MNVPQHQNISLNSDLIVDTQTAAQLLSIPAATLSKWRCTGQNNIPFIKIGGHVRYSTKALREYVERHSTGGAK